MSAAIFNLFGMSRVMPRQFTDLLVWWQGGLGRRCHIVIWKAILHCLMWCLWRERNARTFEDCERNVLDLKLKNFRTLFDWMSANGLFSFASF
jgi:hypothetical protein